MSGDGTALLVALVCLALVALLIYRISIIQPRRLAARQHADVEQWQATGTYPPVVSRRYPSPSVANADLEQMQGAGYRIDHISWTRYGLTVLWQRGQAPAWGQPAPQA